MPVTLTVRSSAERYSRRSASAAGAASDSASLTFDASRIVIGRGASCDLRLPDATVSARHASIRARGAGWTIVDEGSTNGTFLNDERLTPHGARTIHTGDVVRVGRIELAMRLGSAPISSPAATQELALALVARAMGEAPGARPLPSVVVIDGPDAGAAAELVAGEIRTIGRDPRCALRVSDPSVPPIAVDVSLGKDGARTRVALRDGRGIARLGERSLRAGESAPWGDGVVLTLGATRLRLDDPIDRALQASALGDDEELMDAPPSALASEPSSDVTQGGGGAQGSDGGGLVETRSDGAARPGGLIADDQVAPPASDVAKSTRPPGVDRRRSWRGATLAFEVAVIVIAVLVLGGSIAGLFWLLRH